jgi:hypothetical protein
MQRYTVFFIAVNTLHVSGGFSAHHQELKTIHTACGTCQACLLLPLVVAPSKLDIYQMLCVQFWAPDDGRRNSLKHVEYWQQWRILYNVASCWLYLKEYINDARSHERQKYWCESQGWIYNCSELHNFEQRSNCLWFLRPCMQSCRLKWYVSRICCLQLYLVKKNL